jgi:hypothetical protein
MMSTLQLHGGVSAKDPDNLLLNVILRKQLATDSLLFEASSAEEKKRLARQADIYQNFFSRLTAYGVRVDEMNSSRASKGLSPLTWMHPKWLEASLNI